jgi:hypothetical protein
VRVRLRAYWVVSQSWSRLRRSVDALKKILGSGSVCCARTRPLLAVQREDHPDGRAGIAMNIPAQEHPCRADLKTRSPLEPTTHIA